MAQSYEKIRHFAIRETKASAELSLPGKIIRNTPAYMESSQAVLYDKYRRDLAAEVLVDGLKTMDDAEEILKRLLRLVQVASNPSLVDHSYDGTQENSACWTQSCGWWILLVPRL